MLRTSPRLSYRRNGSWTIVNEPRSTTSDETRAGFGGLIGGGASPRDIQKVEGMLAKANALLKAKGIDVTTGLVVRPVVGASSFSSGVGLSAAAFWSVQAKELVVYTDNFSKLSQESAVRLLIHELGHKYFWSEVGWLKRAAHSEAFEKTEKHPYFYVSSYARTDPQEDFAETFMYDVTGRLDPRSPGAERYFAATGRKPNPRRASRSQPCQRRKNSNADLYQGPFCCEMCGGDVYLGQRAAVYHDDYGYVPSCEFCALKHKLPQKGFPVGILRRQSGGGFYVETSMSKKNPTDLASYLRSIRNPAKRAYAIDYVAWVQGRQRTRAESAHLGGMAKQAVRLEVARILGQGAIDEAERRWEKNPRETKAAKGARLDASQELYVVKFAFEPLGSFNWKADPSVKIGGKPTFHTYAPTLERPVWANSRGVIVGGVGQVHGADVFEAVKYLRFSAERSNPLPLLLPMAVSGVVAGASWEGVKALARSGDHRSNAGPPFGHAEAAAYSRVATALARGGKGAVKPAAMLRRAGLLRDWELRRYAPAELAQIATGRLGERLEQRRGNPLAGLLLEGLATGIGAGLGVGLGVGSASLALNRFAPRRANHPGAFIFAIGNEPGKRGHCRPARPLASPRRANDAGGAYKIKLPADRVLGTMSLEAAMRKWPDVRVQVEAFRDMNRGADPSGEVILWDDGRKDVQCGYVFGKNNEMVYGGPGGSPPGSFKNSGGVEGGPEEGTTWVHQAPNQYWVGHAKKSGSGKPVTRDFNSIGATRASNGWLRERGE